MPLPRTLVYNDLTGDEVKHILIERFTALLNDIPYLQHHITLPRVRMTLNVDLDCWADQKNPERRSIADQVDVRAENATIDGDMVLSANRSSVVDSSRKGDPPDKIRDEYGLGVPTPVRGPLSIEDRVEGRRMTMPNGATVDRTGQAQDARGEATVVRQDFGPLKTRGQKEMNYGNRERSGPIAPPDFKKVLEGDGQ